MRAVQRLKAWAGRLKRDAVTLWFVAKSPLTPWYAKALGFFVVAYALSPIDLIPDFVPVLGYLDDLVLLPVLIWMALKVVPPEVVSSCRVRADEWMRTEGRKPRSRAGLVFVFGAWLAIGALAWSAWGPRWR